MTKKNFEGFPADGLLFLQDLAANNNRPWFEANRARYKSALEAPAKLFLSEMEQTLSRRFGEAFTGKIFRMHRDLRFSKDKTPYNAHVRMAFFAAGDTQAGRGFYVSLEPEGFVLGGGVMSFSSSCLENFRQLVVDEQQGPALGLLLSVLDRDGFRLDAPELKRVPTGFDKTHPREALLRRKSLTLWKDFDDHDALGGKADVTFCVGIFEALGPLREMLSDL